MKMDKVAGSGNDNYGTPCYAIEPLKKYIDEKRANVLRQRYESAYASGLNNIPEWEKEFTVWCPFDTQDSNYVKLLELWGYNVIFTHIDNNEDFFELATRQFIQNKIDFVVSNPPYSKKTEVLQRLFDLDVGFAMLVGVVGLFESQKRFEMFRDNSFEIMYFNKRVSFYADLDEEKPSANPPFSSVYVCRNFLPSQIVFETIKK